MNLQLSDNITFDKRVNPGFNTVCIFLFRTSPCLAIAMLLLSCRIARQIFQSVRRFILAEREDAIECDELLYNGKEIFI